MTKTEIIAELRRLGIAHRAKAPKAELECLLDSANKPKRSINVDAKCEFKPFKDGTKQAMLFDPMSRKGGASLDELCAATGWTARTVKSAFYLDLAKLHGVGVRTTFVGTEARYHAVV